MSQHIRLRFILPATLIFLFACIYLPLQGRIIPAVDGNGPDPHALEMLLLMVVMGIALALSTLHAVFARSGGRRGAIVYHTALWLIVGIVIAAPKIRTAFSTYEAQQAPAWNASNAVANGTLKDIERYYAQARAETDDVEALNERMASAALAYSRVDVLMFLKRQGVLFAEQGAESAWIHRILEVLNESRRQQPQATLETVQWLLGEGAPLGFSLKAQAADFSSIDLYFTAYEAIDNPATRRLMDLLVANGADTVGGCQDSKPCPLVYVAGKGMTDAVRYLLAHGADPNSVDPYDDTTALSSAIRGHSAETVKLLLDAGARLRSDAHDNDLVQACDFSNDAYLEQSKAVVRVLHDASIRTTPEALARYQGSINDEQRTCLAAFL
ncbi:ankyrin repeat domain-containing protein [Achromobacter aloeverae]